jgi:hypothetical protein
MDHVFTKKKLFNPLFNGVVTVFIFSRLIYIFIVNNCTSIMPDENFYLQMIYGEEINNMSNSIRFFSQFIYYLYYPSKLIAQLGMDPVVSARIQSLFLSVLALYFLLASLLRALPKNDSIEIIDFLSKSRLRFVLFFVILIPSNLVWSVSILREPIIILLLTVLIFLLINFEQKGFQSKLSLFLFILILTILSITKFYVYLIFICSSIFIFVIRKRGISLLVITSIMLTPIFFNFSTFIGTLRSESILTKSSVSEISPQSTVSEISPQSTVSEISPQSTVSEISPQSNLSITDVVDNSPADYYGQTLMGLSKCRLIDVSIFENVKNFSLESQLGSIQSTEKPLKQNVTFTDDNSKTVNSDFDYALQSYNSFLLFERIFNFLLFPSDLHQRSFIVLLGSLESALWFVLYILYFRELFVYFKLKFRLSNLMFILLLFILLFILASSFFESNFGTSLRHRSILLYPLLFSFLYLQLFRKIVLPKNN